ncbi:MAG: D-alanyl-D-alanine carboxypeptidase/D-alanyl-D-alanine-endopeptidase [Bacteroidales bacterium]|nr:D-alanyl-D-alanine carboxypeptidase/D-alanyl-D-alanine-endopeptidase [Bacteroidales bacterium]
MRQHLLFYLLLLLLPLNALSQTRLGFEGEESASVGIYVKNLSTGQVVAWNDTARALAPASIMKSVTCAAAIYSLGDKFNFITPVYLEGQAEDNSSHWDGNLVVRSCGDPTIDSELFKDRTAFSTEIVNALKSLGIKSISGKIIIRQPMLDQGWLPGWQIDDVPWPYGAGLFGFNYRDNYYSLWPATGETKPYVPDLKITLQYKKGSTDLARGVFSDNLIVYGSDLKNPKWKVNVSMNDPARVFTYELTQKLSAAGIKLSDKDVKPDAGKELLVVEHYSPNATAMLRKMMHESHNLYAEGFLRALAPGESREKAILAEARLLQEMGVFTGGNRVCDGSGLSRANRLQPRFIADVLEAAALGERGSAFVSTFPRAGKEGTVRNLLAKTSMAGRFALKSGSMSGVQCYAGFKLDANGKPTHTVVIMVNSFFCPRAQVRASIEKLLLDIK